MEHLDTTEHVSTIPTTSTINLGLEDRALLEGVIRSNLALVSEVRKNRKSSAKLITSLIDRLMDLCLLGCIGWGGLHLYSTLETGAKQDLAAKALNTGIPALIALGSTVAYSKNKRQSSDIDKELGDEDEGIESIIKEYMDKSTS